MWSQLPQDIRPHGRLFVIHFSGERQPEAAGLNLGGAKIDISPGAIRVADDEDLKLETGAEVICPAFVEIGNLIKIDTRTNEYLERAKS